MAARSSKMAGHQHLYKAKTPPWKEVYRSRCRERLKKQRQALFEQFRSIEEDCQREKELAFAVNSIVRQEWDNLRHPHGPTLLVGRQQSCDDISDEDERLVEETQREIIEEEMRTLGQYEDTLKSETKAVNAAVASWANDGVLCPVCFQNYLEKRGHSVTCNCGLNLWTDNSLEAVRHAIEWVVSVHSASCNSRPVFSLMRTNKHVDEILCTCETCDFLCPLM